MTTRFSPNASLPVLLLLLLLTTGSVWAQVGRPMPGAPAGTAPAGGAPTGGGDKVDLIHADSLAGATQPGAVVRRLIHNVKLQQKGVVLYCDLAIQNTTTNVIEAYGNVRMVQGDTIDVRGDTLYYYGNTRQANVLGHVVLKDRKMTLNTARLDYDMLTGLAHYPVKGRIIDRENTLTSEEGDYYTGNKQFVFKRNVRLLNQPPGKEKTTILGDSLLYNSLTKIADFQGPTRIISKDGTLVARNGQYNTITRVSNFRQRATAETDKYTLTGDTLNFDNVNEVGVAHGNVVIVNKADKTTLTGDHGRYNGKAGVSRMIGHAVVRSPISQGPDRDTLFMRADTLFSFDNKLTKKKKLIGLKNVLVFKSDLQSKCDSLVYDVNDSLLYFYKKPIVWSQNYQMEADSMTARLKNNRISVMYLKTRAFVISQDTLRNFNQVKGRQITAYFRTILAPLKKAGRPTGPITASSANRPTLAPIVTTTATAEQTTLDRVLVEGNGQTIYFAVDEKNRLVGMNRTECSKMNIEFTDSRVTRIRNYGRPDMFLTPPKELTAEKKQLDGFRWREKEKPTRAQTLGLTPLDVPKPASTTTTVAATLGDKIRAGEIEAAKPVAVQLMNRAALAAKGTTPTNGKSVIAQLAASSAGNEPVLEKAVDLATNKLLPAANRPVAGNVAVPTPTIPKSLTSASRQPASVKVAGPAVVNQPTKPVVAIASPAASASGPVVAPVSRQPLLAGSVSPLMPKPFRPVPVSKPAVLLVLVPTKPTTVVAPVADKPLVPVADAVNGEPVLTKPATPTVEVPVATVPAAPVSDRAEPADKPVINKAPKSVVADPITKPVVTKAAESAKPVAASSSSSTLPTRRAEKQQKATSRVVPNAKPKVVPAHSAEESDLEQALNRKAKKH